MSLKESAKIRDAARSREAILEAAERLFAELGFEGASLNTIGSAAGLSRGTPSYFFGSKDGLYVAVLERAFELREQATRKAFVPLVEWARAPEPEGTLREAIRPAIQGYMDFMLDRPAFLKLVSREELDGARRLTETRRESQAIEEGFRAVRRVATDRGLASFRVGDAVLVFVSLTFSPLAQRETFMAAIGRDLGNSRTRREHTAMVADQLLHLLGAPAVEW